MTDATGRIQFGAERGQLLIRTRRAGLAARVGHDLTIAVTRWSVRLDAPDGVLERAAVHAEIELDSLAVRDGTGGVVPLTADDRREIDGNMRRILAPGGGARAEFDSTRVVPAPGGGAIDGSLRLHGATRPVRLQVRELGPRHYRGTATVRQSDFGIKPYTAFLGALKLRDEVDVEIEVDLGTADPDRAAR